MKKELPLIKHYTILIFMNLLNLYFLMK